MSTKWARLDMPYQPKRGPLVDKATWLAGRKQRLHVVYSRQARLAYLFDGKYCLAARATEEPSPGPRVQVFEWFKGIFVKPRTPEHPAWAEFDELMEEERNPNANAYP